MGLVHSRCAPFLDELVHEPSNIENCRGMNLVTAGTVMYSVMVYDPSVTGRDWIAESKCPRKRYKTQVVKLVRVLRFSLAAHACLYKLHAICEVLIFKLLSSCC